MPAGRTIQKTGPTPWTGIARSLNTLANIKMPALPAPRGGGFMQRPNMPPPPKATASFTQPSLFAQGAKGGGFVGRPGQAKSGNWIEDTRDFGNFLGMGSAGADPGPMTSGANAVHVGPLDGVPGRTWGTGNPGSIEGPYRDIGLGGALGIGMPTILAPIFGMSQTVQGTPHAVQSATPPPGQPGPNGTNPTPTDGPFHLTGHPTQRLANLADHAASAFDGLDTAAADTVTKQFQSIMADNTLSVQERVAAAQAYRTLLARRIHGADEVKQINNSSIVAEYHRLLQQEKDAHNEGRKMADPNEGGFYSTYKGALNSSAQDNYGPGFLIAQDQNGFYYISDIDDIVTTMTSAMRHDPAAAARMMTVMAQMQEYGAGSEKYVADRVHFDANGNPVAGAWSKDDQTALKTFLADMALQQAGGDPRPWDQIMSELATQSAAVVGAGTGAGGGGGGGGRRGGGGYGGGGGYSKNTGVSYTDSNLLKQQVNSIARARLGYVLTDAQVNEFVADYHKREGAFVNARMAGLDGYQLDPESSAAAWIESHFRDEMAAQAGNSFIMQLTQFLMGGGQGTGSGLNAHV